MKLSYYMRGLGTGIVVTALIMGIATRNTMPPALTEAEIRAAAEKLGMVESSSLKLSDIPSLAGSQTPPENMDGEGGENAGNKETPDGMSEPGDAGNDETSDGTPEPGNSGNAGRPEGTPETGDAGNEETPEGTPEPGNNGNAGRPEGTPETGDAGNEETPEPEGTTTYTVTVKAGSGSRAICNQLEEQGLIEDAGEFDQYLINNGYSKRISVGTYEIEAGADWERIAKIITKSR